MFKPSTYAKNVIFMQQQLLNRPQLYLLMHLITEILIIMTIVIIMTLVTLLTSDTVKLLSKNVTGLQKINKTNKKHFGGRPTS